MSKGCGAARRCRRRCAGAPAAGSPTPTPIRCRCRSAAAAARRPRRSAAGVRRPRCPAPPPPLPAAGGVRRRRRRPIRAAAAAARVGPAAGGWRTCRRRAAGSADPAARRRRRRRVNIARPPAAIAAPAGGRSLPYDVVEIERRRLGGVGQHPGERRRTRWCRRSPASGSEYGFQVVPSISGLSATTKLSLVGAGLERHRLARRCRPPPGSVILVAPGRDVLARLARGAPVGVAHLHRRRRRRPVGQHGGQEEHAHPAARRWAAPGPAAACR